MIGRKVRCAGLGTAGEVIRWEPLGTGRCDVLVRESSGKPEYGHYLNRECWYSSTDLQPDDGGGPLPRRDVMRDWARVIALDSLRAARDQHIADFHKPWPGCEHGKVIVGNAIVGAIQDLENEK